jgi:hypothetical protein
MQELTEATYNINKGVNIGPYKERRKKNSETSYYIHNNGKCFLIKTLRSIRGFAIWKYNHGELKMNNLSKLTTSIRGIEFILIEKENIFKERYIKKSILT